MNTLSACVAAELRAEVARRRMSGRELSRRIGLPAATVSRRLRGDTPIALDDLENVTAALGVDLIDLLRAAEMQRAKLPRKDSNLQPAG